MSSIYSTCDRCKNKVQFLRMSIFNTDMCCKECLKTEQKHPLYSYAKEKELEHVKMGCYNFEGIGIPEDLINFNS